MMIWGADPMTSAHENRIRQRAHQLWVQAGSPEGRDEEFWHEAEAQILKEEQDKRADPMSPGRTRGP